MKRHDVVSTLKNLYPICRQEEARYEALANHTTDTFWKAVFIRYWQKYAQCVCELEDKIRAHGGEMGGDSFARQDGDTEQAVSYRYEQALSAALPIDVQMMLQHHILIFKEVEKRMETSQKPAPPELLLPHLAGA